jgi:hypothetical protein
MSEIGVTKSSDKFLVDELRHANQRPPPKREASMPALPFYERHPEWKTRPPRQLRRRARLIRGG